MFKAAIISLTLASAASAVDITIDMNGFPNLAGGQYSDSVSSDPAVKFTKDDQPLVIKDLKAGHTYNLDFYHNTGENGSDFAFTINEAGTGVDSVTLGGEKHTMVTGFKPGDTTLKLNTVDIVYNANSTQTGEYFISGLIPPYSMGFNSIPQKLKAIPGWYPVDNLYNSGGGNEDFHFLVNTDGSTGPLQEQDAEYAEFDGNKINPRATLVHFKIEASEAINYHTTHAATAAQPNGTTYEFDMPMTIGSGGINLWSFGKSTVTKSNVMAPETKDQDGNIEKHKLEGTTRDNDFYFMPRLRYDLTKKTFYFETTDAEGRSDTAKAEAAGKYDDGEKPLTVTVTATIVKPAAPAEPAK